MKRLIALMFALATAPAARAALEVRREAARTQPMPHHVQLHPHHAHAVNQFVESQIVLGPVVFIIRL